MNITLPALATGFSAFAIASALVTTPILASETKTSDGVGEAVAVIDQANISGEIGERKLAVGARVFMGDLIKTDGAGEAQLLFADETRMVVGPNSSLIIDEFVFRNEASVSKFAVRALGGAFRFVTGKSEKESYSIRTPSATIGVRGTAFDFTVDPDGQTDLVLFHGEAHICGAGGVCKSVIHACDLATSPLADTVRLVREERQRARTVSSQFPYVNSQESLREDFKVVGGGSCGDVAEIDLKSDEPPVTIAAAPPPPPPPPPPPADDPPPPPPPTGDGNNGIGNDDVRNGCKGGGCNDPSNPGNAGGNSGNAGGGNSGSAGGGNGGGGNSASGSSSGGGKGNGKGKGGGKGSGRGGRG